MKKKHFKVAKFIVDKKKLSKIKGGKIPPSEPKGIDCDCDLAKNTHCINGKGE